MHNFKCLSQCWIWFGTYRQQDPYLYPCDATDVAFIFHAHGASQRSRWQGGCANNGWHDVTTSDMRWGWCSLRIHDNFVVRELSFPWHRSFYIAIVFRCNDAIDTDYPLFFSSQANGRSVCHNLHHFCIVLLLGIVLLFFFGKDFLVGGGRTRWGRCRRGRRVAAEKRHFVHCHPVK